MSETVGYCCNNTTFISNVKYRCPKCKRIINDMSCLQFWDTTKYRKYCSYCFNNWISENIPQLESIHDE
jgi:hypothetical protein